MAKTEEQRRYGIGEWYGKLFTGLAMTERRGYANTGSSTKHNYPCPFRAKQDSGEKCVKAGGVCSLRLYQKTPHGVTICENRPELVTTCPLRFWEGNKVFTWVSEKILGQTTPAVVVKEVGFLNSLTAAGEVVKSKKVGNIDMVLMIPDTFPLKWCALEIQAVYFSGASMSYDFDAIKKETTDDIVFPTKLRRPDFRSSGPKRLMPQLQIKVPTLRRWGKKTAVVVDKPFFDSLSPMDRVDDLSNADIAWFVVAYEEKRGIAEILLHDTYYTTLERAVEGLTAGQPIALDEFENEVKNQAQNKPEKIIRLE